MENNFTEIIENGEAVLGIEFGSTRIKAVLSDVSGNVLAVGGFDWENHYEGGYWTYPLEEVWDGLAKCYTDLSNNVKEKYGTVIKNLKAFGISAMMHGYLPFDANGNQLAEFRTWRNSTTAQSAEKLTNLFQYNIPQRWSIAHLYQAILNNEEHVKDISFLSTLATYVHWKLTGKKVAGVGEASGMFPINISTKNYDKNFLGKFSDLISEYEFPWKLEKILPEVLVAGQNAGSLTEEGAKLIDVSGNLCAGAIACPPEGDAGTGMVATNSLAVRTGNVSAGTSAFAMLVLEKDLKELHTSIDMVTTPAGDLVAMSHANNCTTEINYWINLFKEIIELQGNNVDTNNLYTTLFENSLNGDPDCGGLLPYGFHSGEDIVGLEKGAPSFVRPTESNFNAANFIKSQIYSSFAAMKIGMDILIKDEGAKIDKIVCHGGIFKTKGVAQKYLANALASKVETFSTASEGGAWGIALLAAFTSIAANNENLSLEEYVDKIFESYEVISVEPNEEDIKGYEKFMENYKLGLEAEKLLVDKFN